MTVQGEKLAAGQQLGRFRVGHTLGSDRNGTVYEALDTGSQRQVAMRVFGRAVETDPEQRDRLTSVARVLRRLESDHVVRVQAVGETDGRTWVVSELVADGNLADVLGAQGAPQLPVAVDCVAQVAAGIADAHAVGLRHGDLRAGDVLLEQHENATFRAVVTGFGSHEEDRLVEPAQDVRALGALLWAVVSGDPAYDGAPAADGGPPQLMPGSAMAVEVNRVLRRTLAPAPGEEYRTAAELRRDLATVAAAPEEPVRADAAAAGTPTPGTVRRPTPPAPSDPELARQVLIASVLAVLLVVGAIVAAALAVG